ncbi:P-loop containing nucleoside triphosphate hydrolase protein [Linderina pennispora]|uniref:DNA 3'-5' helicase n=1 Tax=Linderina pennispora TaxID=61395 RepID=A0A1Y1WAV2_9FUNG|nr:P-loop containing nucleoside triphosphate hydrolase protein [Linderina pennispora]ORX70667.1 P-loop containing nucleoside triphosphate hydrolase protein [Linderina pennispora]
MSNLIDFDDMLTMANKVLKSQSVLQAVRSMYPYLLVDEFQDLNNLQMDLVLRLQGDVGRVTAVGDERQSIYGFRGASCESNFKTFLDSFVDADVARTKGTPGSLVGSMQSLTVNYRSHKSIVDLGNVVARDTAGDDGLLVRLRVPLQARATAPVVPVSVCYNATAHKEATSIADKIKYLIDSGACRPKDISVLFRFLKFGQYRPSGRIETELMNLGIPFVVRGGASLMSTRRMQNFLALLGLLANRSNDIAMRVCVTEFVLHLGPVYWRRIEGMGPDSNGDGSLFRKAERIVSTTKIPKKARESLGHFLATVKGWVSDMGEMTLMELVVRIYTDFVMDASIKAKAKTRFARKAAAAEAAADER